MVCVGRVCNASVWIMGAIGVLTCTYVCTNANTHTHKIKQVYTWGCNDDGAVGRDGDEAVPMLVPDIRYVNLCVFSATL